MYRAERTNWRKLGDFEKYPDLDSYLAEQVVKNYGTTDLEIAAKKYVTDHVLPDLQPYDPDAHFEYPELVTQAMTSNPVYKITRNGTETVRERVSDPGVTLT